MYSRFSQGESGRVKLPPHYSGNAFPREEARMPPKPAVPDQKPPSEPPQGRGDALPTVSPEEDSKQVSAPFSRSFEHLLGHWGFDDLLILGALLLLADAGDDREILLWLILLLFCK